MIFKELSFFQYRCFLDGKVNFTSSSAYNKNITLILAPNGSGKTEMLFAFWWVLYPEDFSFKELLHKEATPYALNSGIYRKIQRGEHDGKNYCEVILKFEHDEKEYLIKRKADFNKTPVREKLSEELFVEFSEIDRNGVISAPIRDHTIVERRLEQIIPKKVLHGIIFDGERMKRISSSDEKSISGIQGVISDITSRDLINISISEFKAVKKEYNKDLRKHAKQSDSNDLFEVSQLIDDIEETIEQDKIVKDEKAELFSNNQIELENISSELKKFEKTKDLETKRETERLLLGNVENNIEETINNLYGELNKNGYMLITNPLFESVEEVLEIYDVPEGLTVDAVNNILKMNNCICGIEFTQKMIASLEELSIKLPPDNMNSLINEIIRQKRSKIQETNERLKEIWKELKNYEEEQKKIKENINFFTSQISDNSEDGEALNRKRSEIDRKQGSLRTEINILNRNIEDNQKKLRKLYKTKEQLSHSSSETHNLQIKLNFIQKSIDALDEIQLEYSKYALMQINDLITTAYRELSEESDMGRSIYITQYTDRKYRILSYYDNKVETFMKNTDWSNYKQYGDIQSFDKNIQREIAIIENAESNSTGQGKSATIAFVKAILDYSKKIKENEAFEITKSYPLVIDAPFGELSGGNLTRAAQKLNQFSEQVILFLYPESYKEVAEYIEDNIGRQYILEKVIGESYSQIRKGVVC